MMMQQMHQIVNQIKMTPSTLQPVIYVTKATTVSACHRLHSNELTDEENKSIFGKCNNPNGHGHNYRVEVTLRGKVDPVTGMLINLTELKKCMQAAIDDVIDHKHLDKDVSYFKDIVSTTENLSIFIWNNMKAVLPKPELLYEVRIHETDSNVVYYRGEQEVVAEKSD